MFIALFDRYEIEEYREFDTKQEAVDFLKVQSDAEQLFPIAVIDSGNKIAWLNDWLEQEESEDRVKMFLNKTGEKDENL